MVSWGVHVLKSLNLKPQKVIAGAFYQFIVHLPEENPLDRNGLRGFCLCWDRTDSGGGCLYFHGFVTRYVPLSVRYPLIYLRLSANPPSRECHKVACA